MTGHRFSLSGAKLFALPSGALWWADEGLLAVSDLHLGRSSRIARLGGTLLPPYEVDETLAKLDAEIARTAPRVVLCLGDSFDDLAAADLEADHRLWLTRLMAGRRWLWIEGNHDPGPVDLPGEHLREMTLGSLTFRHIAEPGAGGEVSGHYHPKIRVAGPARPCFLIDTARVILPAFGAYTGGMEATRPPLSNLMAPGAIAWLTGPTPCALPLKGRR
ncbi:ligase-associated DNA damage response endonuclease PdeM [Defluviimonas sp. WL0075]|uniref:Ligase-associated DNA damage response endonuclease PdeM n=1 Tax=Albidovulum sediminicola TaxID=2984331 RepID=A0ABT2Z3M9_9RHOB|nr:ligase-associated DNA damage response endonuclease PdeM [Defluviimonas sp. WL0075]MCV2865612.1 ligase-associated DNA damage response endonuclease PdeM [Defluviimonas sp. WL0075]